MIQQPNTMPVMVMPMSNMAPFQVSPTMQPFMFSPQAQPIVVQPSVQPIVVSPSSQQLAIVPATNQQIALSTPSTVKSPIRNLGKDWYKNSTENDDFLDDKLPDTFNSYNKYTTNIDSGSRMSFNNNKFNTASRFANFNSGSSGNFNSNSRSNILESSSRNFSRNNHRTSSPSRSASRIDPNLEPVDVGKEVEVLDNVNNPVDSVPNAVKFNLSPEEQDEYENRDKWIENQRYLGFRMRTVKILLAILITIFALSTCGLLVCVVLLIVEQGVNYEWKLYGTIITAAISFCSLITIIFVIAYAKYKYDQYKEVHEEDELSVDEEGRPIKTGAITNIYKYGKKKTTPKRGKQRQLSNQITPTFFESSPQPTFTYPVIHQAPSQPSLQTIIAASPPTRTVSVIRPVSVIEPTRVISVKRQITPVETPVILPLETEKSVIIKRKPASRPLIFTKVLNLFKRKPNTPIAIPIRSNYVVEEDPDRRIQSPSQIDILNRAPSIAKVISPTASSSRLRLLTESQSPNSMNNKPPVILNKNIGENLNAFR